MCLTKYYKNFILCGEADNLCLLCDENFHKLDDIEKHIRWEQHRKLLKAQAFLPKFSGDGIFKAESYYYCQFCNNVLKNMTTLKEHIKTEKHINNKTSPDSEPLKTKVSYDSGYVLIDKLKVDIQQWHGILNKLCVLCNVKVDHVLKHIEAQDHVIKLIQSETKYEDQDKCYRKVNEDTYQCFTCTNTFSAHEFNDHWLKGHGKVTIITTQSNGIIEKPIPIYNQAEKENILNTAYDINKLVDVKDEFYNIDLGKKEVTCKICNSSVRCTSNKLTYHLFGHSLYATKKSSLISTIQAKIDEEYLFISENEDHGKSRSEAAKYGKENYIKMNAGGSRGYCTLCDKFMSAHINIFREHVQGCIHTNHLELNGHIKPRKHKKGSAKVETLTRYLYKIGYLPELEGVGMNMSFCINKYSFLLIKRIAHGPHFKKTKCFACNETFPWGKELSHCESKMHKTNLLAAKVVNERNNFIREIRPKLYHCGLCNMPFPYWETLDKHLEDWGHKMATKEQQFISCITDLQKKDGCLPSLKKIEHSTNPDVFYSNMIKVIFEIELRLSAIHIDFKC